MALKKDGTLSDVQKLILQIERDLLAQTHLKAMLIEAAARVKAHRKDLRVAKARVSHRRPRAPRRRSKR